MIQICNLSKNYGNAEVLNIPELTIATGESVGLVGNNGAGKTTLFRLILDLVRPTMGDISIGDVNVSRSEDWKFITGSFIDEKFLLGYLTPDEYFQFLSRIYQLNKLDLEKHLGQFSSLFNGEITGTSKYIRDLSKGNKKKVGIAAAFMGNPQLIILDEPFENLDPTSQIHLKEIIKKFRTTFNTTFLISSHDLVHVTTVCNRIVLLERGKIKMDELVNSETLTRLHAYFEGVSGDR